MFVHDLFEQIGKRGETPAIIEGDRVLSYREFADSINAVCTRLLALNIPAGSRVGLFLGNSINGYLAVYAAALCGFTYTPLPVDDPPNRLRQMIEDSDLSLILCDETHSSTLNEILKDWSASVLKIDETSPAGRSLNVTQLRSRVSAEFPLYMLFTSGSTGAPKGVFIPRKGVENFLRWAKDYLNVTEKDQFLGHSRLTFDLSVFNLFVPLMAGAAVRLVKSGVEQMYPGELLKKGVTIALMVPRVTGLMLQAGQLSQNEYPKLRHLLFCGEKLMASQANAWMNTHPHLTVHNIYGPTETTVTCTYHRMEPGLPVLDPVPVGKVIPGMRLDFLGAGESLISGAAEGDLIISGVGVSPEDYHLRKTDKFFVHPQLGRCFRTGDLVKRDADGTYFWLCRLDDQIKIRGFRVELGEIEMTLSRESSVRDLACVFDPTSETLTAFVSLNVSAKEMEARKSLESCALKNLPPYMRPSQYIFLQNLPRNANGKVERSQLKQMTTAVTHVL
jgi:amino acid adenylation domain-containing protein